MCKAAVLVGNKRAYRHTDTDTYLLLSWSAPDLLPNQILLQHDVRDQEHISWLRRAAVSAVVVFCGTILSHYGILVTDVPMYKP